MTDLITSPTTQAQLQAFLKHPSHALLLTGPTGIGKFSIAKHLAEQLLELKPSGFENYAYKSVIEPEAGKSISIEAVRGLEHLLSLKVPSKQSVNRIVIITDSHLMTAEAQNALLKTLEEPPEATILILTAADSQMLLPTIRSRAQIIDIKRPDPAQVYTYFQKAGYTEADIKQAMAMSGNLPGLTQALVDDTDHPMKQAAQLARQLLAQKPFERQLLVNDLTSNRQLCQQTLILIQQIAELSLQNRAQLPTAKRWRQILEASYRAQEAINNSAQPKLAITNMLLQF